MGQNSVSIAETYYKAVAEKNLTILEKLLHPDVQFIGPLGEMVGKEKVLEATQKFTSFFKTLKIRTKFGSGDQAMVVYDVEFPPSIGLISSAALMTFKEGLVVRIELFYDARPFEPKKEKTTKKS